MVVKIFLYGEERSRGAGVSVLYLCFDINTRQGFSQCTAKPKAKVYPLQAEDSAVAVDFFKCVFNKQMINNNT